MGKFSDYKKSTTHWCNYCDYCICRKGHPCTQYKKYVKSFGKKSGKNNEIRQLKGI